MLPMRGYPAEIYHRLLDYSGERPFEDLVLPWLDAATEQREWLAAFSRRHGDPVPAATPEELSTLYAQSRLSDLFSLAGSPRIADPDLQWGIEQITLDEYRQFMQAMGFSPIPEVPFSPVFHEIVEVEQSPDPDEPITLFGEEAWSGWMLGPMVFARAGVRVRGGLKHIVKEIAENSTIYWTFARHNRPASDLSHGWGHNSQWATDFRRDYVIDGVAWYNVDADPEPGQDLMKDDGFNDSEIDEIVRHRCFIRCAKPSHDLWPFDHKVVEPLFPARG